MGAPAVSRAHDAEAHGAGARNARRHRLPAADHRRSRSPKSAASTPSGVLNTLLERHLIKIVGRKQVVGRPFLYATTKEFLIRFGLNDLRICRRSKTWPKRSASRRRFSSSRRRRAKSCCRSRSPSRATRPRRVDALKAPRHEGLRRIDALDATGVRLVSSWCPCACCRVAVRSPELPLAAAATSSCVNSRHRPSFSLASRIGPIATRLRCVDRMADRVAHLSHLAVAPFADRDDAAWPPWPSRLSAAAAGSRRLRCAGRR